MTFVEVFLSFFLFWAGSNYVRGGDVPDLLKLIVTLDVLDCPFDDVEIGRAYCRAFAEAAEYVPGTFECLTDETECLDESRRRLLSGSSSRRLLETDSANVALGGTFGGSTEEEVSVAANDVLANETLLSGVKTRAIEILVDEGADDEAVALANAEITGGTGAVVVVPKECDVNEDCVVEPRAPICEEMFCVACNSTFVCPPVQGDCAAEEVCLADGSCGRPPAQPENLTLLDSTFTSLEIGWEDGIPPGIPEENFTVSCYEGFGADCQAPNPAAEIEGLSRGVQTANVTGLSTFTEYTCFVIALNAAVPSGVCSEPLETRTDECETDADCDDYDNEFCLDSIPTRCVACLNDDDCPGSLICDSENKCT